MDAKAVKSVDTLHSLVIYYNGRSGYTVEVATTPGLEAREHFSVPYRGTSREISSLPGFDTYSFATNMGQLGPSTTSLTIYRASESPLKLSHVSYGKWEHKQTTGTTRSGITQWFLFGQRTLDTDHPRTGTANYSVIADGSLYSGSETRIGGTGNIGFDFGESRLSGKIDLNRNVGTANQEHFLTLDFNGMRGSGGPIDAGNGWAGRFAIMYYGPAAAELGGAFQLENQGSVAQGVFVGKKQ